MCIQTELTSIQSMRKQALKWSIRKKQKRGRTENVYEIQTSRARTTTTKTTIITYAHSPNYMSRSKFFTEKPQTTCISWELCIWICKRWKTKLFFIQKFSFGIFQSYYNTSIFFQHSLAFIHSKRERIINNSLHWPIYLSTARFVWILLFPFICILNVQHSMFTQLTQECFSVRSHSNPTFSHSIHSGICFSYFLWWIIYILLLFLLLHRRKSFVLVFSFISISFLA